LIFLNVFDYLSHILGAGGANDAAGGQGQGCQRDPQGPGSHAAAATRCSFYFILFFILFVLQDANVILKDLDLTQQLPLCVFMYFF
jgi:hypothetical protein